jgi:hypothetical protein
LTGGALDDDLRKTLSDQAKAGTTITYAALAERLGLKPPGTIHRLAQALEHLMDEDAAAGRPLLAALCVSKARPGLPGPGFFLKAQTLGLHSEEADERAFHASELRRAISFYVSSEVQVQRWANK